MYAAYSTSGPASVTRLSVNLNRIALLRNSRGIGLPDLLKFAQLAIDAGADGITIHPRPDQRHITVPDAHALTAFLKLQPSIEFNIEGNPFTSGPAAFMPLVRAARPQQCTLVPDTDAQATSDHGWDLEKHAARLLPVIEELSSIGSRVSLFLDPDLAQVRRAKDVGADRIELYTKPWADAWNTPQQNAVLQTYADALATARALGLGVNIGHDLNLQNLPDFMQAMALADEASIGHALTCDALEYGYANAVRAYKVALNGEPFDQFLIAMNGCV
jgi:pyridoxine 5-phosphate synthase